MPVSTQPDTTSSVQSRAALWDVPIAVWAYGMLRSLAFLAPSWTDGGRIGLGVVVVAGLYVLLVRRSRPAWMALVALDSISLLLLVTAWLDAADAPLAVPLLAAASLLVLLAPSTRRYVAGESVGDRRVRPVGSTTPANKGDGHGHS